MKKLLLALLVAGCGTEAPSSSEDEAFGSFNYCLDYKHCTSSAECPAGQACWNGDCRLNTTASRCEWYQWDSYHDYWVNYAHSNAGDRQVCVPFACDDATGYCRTHCTTTADCAVGFVCNDSSCDYVDPPPFYPVGWVPPTTERPGLCSNACSDRAGKSYETCYHGYWIPSTTRCYDNNSVLYWGYYWESCGNYSCNAVRGSCNYECGTSADCAAGHYCDDYAHVCS